VSIFISFLLFFFFSVRSFSPYSFSHIFDTRCTIDIDSDPVSTSVLYVKLYDVIRQCDGDNFSWVKIKMKIIIRILLCFVLYQQGKIFCLFVDLINRIICHVYSVREHGILYWWVHGCILQIASLACAGIVI
jgi:hypothetical protein